MEQKDSPAILHIKNMVCPRCVMAVEQILKELGIEALEIELGKVLLTCPLHKSEEEELKDKLKKVGFELLDNRQDELLETIRLSIIELVRTPSLQNHLKLSAYLTDKLHRDYSALSKLFSEVKGISIEKFYIEQKIERAKELLVYGEATISEIADQLNYSSVAHLSSQFRNVTGLTPTQFKQQTTIKRRSIDKI